MWNGTPRLRLFAPLALLLLAAAPSTRPAVGRWTVRVCRYGDNAGPITATTVSVDPDGNFATASQVEDVTLSVSGQISEVRTHDCRLLLKFDEATVDRIHGGTGHRTYGGPLSIDWARETPVAGMNTRGHKERITVTVNVAP